MIKLYQLVLDGRRKSIRITDFAVLGFDTDIGQLHVHILDARFDRGFGALVAVPPSEHNLQVLGDAGLMVPDQFSEWLIPPFQLSPSAFHTRTGFVRVGRDVSFEAPKNYTFLIQNYETGNSAVFSPGVGEFVPRLVLIDRGVTDLSSRVSRDDWRLMLRIAPGRRLRDAVGEERDYLVIPDSVVSVTWLDLYVARLLAYLRGEPLPMEERIPSDEEIAEEAKIEEAREKAQRKKK